MRIIYFFSLLIFTVEIQAATINTTPLTKTDKNFVETPITTTNSPVTTPKVDSDQNSLESQIAAWKIESAQVGKDYVLNLDRGNYSASWSKGDPIFQKTISQKEWTRALEMARQKLGSVLSRTLKDQRPAFDPKGLPKGACMVIEYNTSFTNARESGELLTLRLGSDGQWRVLTYQVN